MSSSETERDIFQPQVKGWSWVSLMVLAALEKAQEMQIERCGKLSPSEKPWYELFLEVWEKDKMGDVL